MKNPFIGTGVALVTPFRKPASIDFSKLEALINNIIANGVDYIVALGTTSEAATMTDTERHALQDFIIDTVALADDLAADRAGLAVVVGDGDGVHTASTGEQDKVLNAKGPVRQSGVAM